MSHNPMGFHGLLQGQHYLYFPLHTIICKNSVRTSQETHYVTVTKPNRLMLFMETVAVYCEKNMEHINKLCGQNAEFWYVKAGGTYGNH
jgi:hypothetical protein